MLSRMRWIHGWARTMADCARLAARSIVRDTSRMKNLLFVLCFFTAAITQAAENPAAAARTIVLVRHGQYVPDPAADPKLGPGISPLGVAQGHLVGARLAGWPSRFDALYVSPLQ